MAQGFGSFDTTYYGPTYTEDIEAIERGVQEGFQIGANIRQNQIASERQKADLAAQRKRDAANQLALDKQDAAVREGLILQPESKSDNLNDARLDFSNMLVDKLNQLKIARDSGSITAADYSKGAMMLQSQIPAYKAAEKVMYSGVEQYMDALNEGRLSEANDPEAVEFWSAMTRGDAEVGYKISDDGSISLSGTWTDSDGKKQKIDAALAEMDRLPFISQRPETTVKDQLAADAKNVLDTKAGNAMKVLNPKTGQYEADYHAIHNDDGSLTPWFKQFATESFDGYFNGLGRGDKTKALKEYLMDSVDVADRKVLMDQLAGGDAESYGINSLNRLLEGKNSTDINNFINSYVKTNWLDQSKNAVLEANKQMINSTNADAYKASLELRKDEANTQKAIYQAQEAGEKVMGTGKEVGDYSYVSNYLDNVGEGDFDLFTKGNGFEFGSADGKLVITKLDKEGSKTNKKFDFSLDDLTKMVANETLSGQQLNPSSTQYEALRNEVANWWKTNGEATKKQLEESYMPKEEPEEKGFITRAREYLFGN